MKMFMYKYSTEYMYTALNVGIVTSAVLAWVLMIKCNDASNMLRDVNAYVIDYIRMVWKWWKHKANDL